MGISEKLVRHVAFELLKDAATRLPPRVERLLRAAYKKERHPAGKAQLRTILDNLDAAREGCRLICQDTGLPLFFINLGLRAGVKCDLGKALKDATLKASRAVPYRPNVIHPLRKENPGTNVGWGMPYIYYTVEPESEWVEITAFPKGFGAEAKSGFAYVTTDKPVAEAVIKCVLDNICLALGEPCPPVIIGVGLGGTADIAMSLAKRALVRQPLGGHHRDPEVSALETHLLEAVNRTGIGPMAVGGDTTALAVHVEICGTHTAGLPVAINFQCWAARHSTARIHRDGRVEYLTHPR
ncbi:MAG: fumarate hydratase [Candidatus Bathyarchaeia archaeon]